MPVKFLRSRGMEALPEPEDGETIELLREFISWAEAATGGSYCAASHRPPMTNCGRG